MIKRPVYIFCTASMLFAVGLFLPFLTGQIADIGNMLLPLHIPVLLCGFICGWKWGLAVGFLLPLARSLFFGMPLFYPHAVNMAFELMAYGFLVGFIYSLFKNKNLFAIYISLISAMLVGRVVKGAVAVILYAVMGSKYSFTIFVSGAFVDALPGIVLQLILVPLIIEALRRARVI